MLGIDLVVNVNSNSLKLDFKKPKKNVTLDINNNVNVNPRIRFIAKFNVCQDNTTVDLNYFMG